MRRACLPMQCPQRLLSFLNQQRQFRHVTPLLMTTTSTTTNNNTNQNNNSNYTERLEETPATSILPGPYRRVGNIFIIHCDDHPFHHSWEINRMLRELRLEFRGQTSIVPDVPEVRRRLWRVRHVVQIDMLDLDEAKLLIGVPAHINFTDLAAQLPLAFGRVRAVSSPVMRSKMNFMKLRRMRLRDVLHRDALELRLLEEKRKLLAASQNEEENKKNSLDGKDKKEEVSGTA